MKINVLKKIALDNKYTIERRYRAGHDEIALYSHHYGIDRQVVRINNETKGILFISNGSSSVNDLNVIKAAIEFAETDPEDREGEKKFWIQHKFMVSKNLLPVNLVWNKLKDVYRSINLKMDNHIYQAQFTFKEYEEIKEKLDTDLKDFELVEVRGWMIRKIITT